MLSLSDQQPSALSSPEDFNSAAVPWILCKVSPKNTQTLLLVRLNMLEPVKEYYLMSADGLEGRDKAGAAG